MYDVIVVGARCAGSPLAMLLAQQGARVLLVDRSTFPSDIPHGHFIHRDGPARLRRWGLLDAIEAVAPPASSAVTDFGDFSLLARDLVEDGLPWAYGPRRSTLDQLLVDAAANAGAEVRQGFSVDEFVIEEGRLAGIRGHERTGRPVEERATITVGADGRNSRLARTVQAPVYRQEPPILCYYFSYWSGVQAEDFELHVRLQSKRVILAFKTDGGLLGVFLGLPVQQLREFRADIEASFMRSLDDVPGFAERLRAGYREERFYGASDLPNFYRRPFGPGWALVGDAGFHKDPYLALGISDAFRDAEMLAGAITDGLGGRQQLDDALAGYQQRRDRLSAADYEENLAGARLTPLTTHGLALRAAVKNDPAEATRLTKARMHMTDPAEYFTPENMQRLLGKAAPAVFQA